MSFKKEDVEESPYHNLRMIRVIRVLEEINKLKKEIVEQYGYPWSDLIHKLDDLVREIK